MNISQFYKLIRYKINCIIGDFGRRKARRNLRKEIINYFFDNPTNDTEINEILEHLKSHKLTDILMPGRDRIKQNSVTKVFVDMDNGFPYVIHEGFKLYFKKGISKKSIENVYLNLVREQDVLSPHCYTSNEFSIKSDEVLYDIGAAEGFFTLMHIDKIKHAFLFEIDPEWIEVLKLTFSQWMDKITIVPYFVSDIHDDKSISIDKFVTTVTDDLKPDFIKIDVEGAESKVLNGMGSILGKKDLKISLATYHYLADYDKFTSFFKRRNYLIEPSKGLTLLSLEPLSPPYFRKGIIRLSNQ